MAHSFRSASGEEESQVKEKIEDRIALGSETKIEKDIKETFATTSKKKRTSD